MRQSLRVVAIAVIGCLATIALPQTVSQRLTKGEKATCPTDSSRDVVERLWDMAASGEMVTNWEPTARLFSEPGPRPSDRTVRVFSDYWWVEYFECSNEPEAVVMLRTHWDRTPGVIDSRLHFTPPPQSSVQAGTGYRLVMETPHMYYWGADGKPIPAKPIHEPKRWLIQGPPPAPFLTVTAAIRYVLEKRSNTTDPTIKKNADETLAELLKIH
jgi:hypothetical protein